MDHSSLCDQLLTHFYLDEITVNLIAGYICNRKRALSIGILSHFLPLSKVLPQGLILRSLLFCLFINDLPNSVKSMFTHLYADYTEIYKVLSLADIGSSIEEVKKMFIDLRNLWSRY